MIFNCLNAEQVLDKQNEDFDFDGLPGVTYEFKIEVYSGQEQCFYQKIANGATLHLSFEVLRGSDKLVDVVIWDPNNNQVDAKHSVTSGYFENKITFEEMIIKIPLILSTVTQRKYGSLGMFHEDKNGTYFFKTCAYEIREDEQAYSSEDNSKLGQNVFIHQLECNSNDKHDQYIDFSLVQVSPERTLT
ncbi:TMED6 [Mytilus edulis]|uniref:TMED6 n=1 Tax=Mytilus edulis TaxID=6550 RepID=A0A8S3QXC8_MYTED|nr:TMED6 [Mytilus edulis]